MWTYLNKETFQQIINARSPKDFDKFQNNRGYWASHCQIVMKDKAAMTNKSYLDAVLNLTYQKNYYEFLEDFNSLSQIEKSKARGYISFVTIITIIYLITGKFVFSKINNNYSTHTNYNKANLFYE